MAKAKLKAEISIKGIQEVENLVELIARYKDNLPLELQNSLKEVEKYGIGDFTQDDFIKRFGFGAKLSVVCDEIKNTTEIISINKILKKVVHVEDANLQKHTYPKSFQMYVNDELIISW